MADEDNERELELEETDKSEEGAPTGRNKKKLIIMAVAVLFVLGGAGGGAYWFFGQDSGEEMAGEEAVEEEVEEPQGRMEYLELKPAFVVNFPSRGRQRFLQTSITIMGRDLDALQAVVTAMPIIRHNLVTLLGAQSLTSIQTPAGIEELRIQATREVQQVLMDEIGREGIEQVLFTAFVMQ